MPPEPPMRLMNATEATLDAPGQEVDATGWDVELLPRATGRYEILGKLGAGGMGVVYTAYDPLLDCKVALKQLHPHLVAERGFLERLRTEARAMARLRAEPHVVTLYDFFFQDEVVFVVMELVEGQTLRAWQRERHRWSEVVGVYIQAGRGLAAAHRSGLTHRDFKPENVLLDGRGIAKVGDFGLARADRSRGKTLEDIGDPALTRAGTIVGTPRYMAPEQLLGQVVDARGDQFSFCIALWEALFAEHPFFGGAGVVRYAGPERSSDSTMGQTGVPLPIAFSHAILGGSLRSPPAGHHVPGHIVRALVRGLEREPADRFPDMDGLLVALGGAPTRGRALGLGVTAALAGVLGWSLSRPPTPPPPPTRAELVADASREIAADLALPATDDSRHVSAALARYGERWAAQHADQAFALQQRPGDPSATTRIRCLEDQRRTAVNLVRGLREAPVSASWHAAELVEDLQGPEECGHMPREWLACTLELAALATDPAAAPAFTAAAAALHSEAAGDFTAAVRHAEDARRWAEGHGHAVLRADVGYRLGRLHYLSGNADAALAALAAARTAAEPTGCLDLRANIYSRMIKTTAMYPSESAAAAEEWSRMQEILARASPDGGERLADVYNERGLLRLLRRRDPAGALQNLERAVMAREWLLGGRPSTDLADSYLNIGIARHQLGQLDAAEQALAEATRLRAAVVGPAHPLHYKEELARGELLTDRGRFDDAIESLERARARVEAGLQRDSGPRARVLLALARAHQGAQRPAQALGFAREAAAAANTAAIDPSEGVELRVAAAGLAAEQGDAGAAQELEALARVASRDPRIALETQALVAHALASQAYAADDPAAAARYAERELTLLARAGLREGDAVYGEALRLRGLAAYAREDLDAAIADLETVLAVTPGRPAREADEDRLLVGDALLLRKRPGDIGRACALMRALAAPDLVSEGVRGLLQRLQRVCRAQ